MYAAMTHSPGCLPDTAEDLPTFDTAAEAWTYLADSLTDDEGWTPESEDDPEGPHRRSDLALDLEEHARHRRAGPRVTRHGLRAGLLLLHGGGQRGRGLTSSSVRADYQSARIRAMIES